MKISKNLFGELPNSERVHSFILKNDNSISITLIEYGASVHSIETPDRNGYINDVALGYSKLEDYVNDVAYIGATVGRVTNRIGNASFFIDEKKYDIAPNTLPDFGRNHIHGGNVGFNKKVWKGEQFTTNTEVGVIFSYLSVDDEEGYPGNLKCEVKYSLNNKGELRISYKATTDKTTIVNFTHHSYFNLKGAGKGDVLNHIVEIAAENHTVLSKDLIPTGIIEEVSGAIDFRNPRNIGSKFSEMKMEKFTGYDNNFIVNHNEKNSLTFIAKATEIISGRILEVFTTQPCMHFYTGNLLKGELGKNNNRYKKYGGFCFEPQGYPDATNHNNFESILLSPNNEYSKEIIYKFSTQK